MPASKYPSTKAKPIVIDDFSRGRITPYSVSPTLVPVNSVSSSKNVNFDEVIGSGKVRQGTTLLGTTVAVGYAPLGLTEFVGFGGTPNYLVGVFKGASTSTIYYYNGTSWQVSKTGLPNTSKCRFDRLGGRLFLANGDTNPGPLTYQGMISTADAVTWNTTNCIPQTEIGGGTLTEIILGVMPTLIKSFKGRLLIAGNRYQENLKNHSKDRVFFSNVINQDPTQYPCTLTCDAYGVITGRRIGADTFPFQNYDVVTIKGANQAGYNGTFYINGGNIAFTTYNTFDALTSPATGTITVGYPQVWFNTKSDTGDWIDINPDDGDTITAFGEAADQLLVFKSRAMYRLDVVNKSVDTSNIYNVGAVSQEAVTTCNGLCYFFSGGDIRRTNGGFPEQISRLAVQDFIDAIPQANWSEVYAGNDGQNVYFSIGTVTLDTNKDTQRTWTNVVLKYSTRDESWSVHEYAQRPAFFTQYTTSTDGRKMISADLSGNVQTFNKGTTDNGSPIFYELETQEIDFGNRAHSNSVSANLAVFGQNFVDSNFEVKADNRDYKPIKLPLTKRVNVGDGISTDGYFFKFKWSGNSIGTPPIFEGFQIEDINDDGMTTE